MSVRSDFCCLFDFPSKYNTQIKNNFTKYIIDILGDTETEYNLFTNFYQIVNDTSNETIQFCLVEESIKFEFISNIIDNFLNFLDTIKDELKINYEAKELCTEYLDIGGDYNRISHDENDQELYFTCQIGGIPETTDITLLDWINQNAKSSNESIDFNNSRSE